MTERKFEITDAKGGSALGVRVVTRATRTEIVGMQEDGSLKIRLKASPAGAPEANKELIAFLADCLGVEEEKIEVVAGEGSREKILSVEGMTVAQVESILGTEK